MSEFRVNVVDDCSFCGAVLTLHSQHIHSCDAGRAYAEEQARKTFEEVRERQLQNPRPTKEEQDDEV